MVLNVYGQAAFTVIAQKRVAVDFAHRISRMVEVHMVRKYQHVISIESMMQSTVR